jgi:hypothetical protein
VSGATIAGTVSGAAATAPAGLTVSVVGANLTASVDNAGEFELAGVPSGNVQLQFRNANVNAMAQLANVGQEEHIRIQVQVNGGTATIMSEVRSGKVTLCHRTESGTYQKIDVSENAEPAHRDHGDAKVGERVPADTTKVFDESCRPVTGPAVRIKKFTNGEDADSAPGPSLVVGSPVKWDYVVTNIGTVALTAVTVSDDQGVAVSCPKAALNPGESMTCTGSGVALLIQYRNEGKVTALGSGLTVSDTDLSHYLGRTPDVSDDGPKVRLCHRTGNGSYHEIEVSVNAEPAHRAHGDGKIGDPVPGSPGFFFRVGCTVAR